MSIRLLVIFDAKPDQADTLVEALQAAKTELIKVPGCEAVEVLHGLDAPNTVMLSEIWESRDIHDRYAAQMAEAGSMDQLAPLLNAEPKTEFYRLA